MRDQLSVDRFNRLELLGFVWNTFDDAFFVGLYHLKKFNEREGHSIVPEGHLEEGFQLGNWVSFQRQKKDKLKREFIGELEKLAFVWSVKDKDWNDGLEALKKFRDREGNCLVPSRHIENGFPLGTWVSWRRSHKNRVNSDRIAELDSLEFIWDANQYLWDRGYKFLECFFLREGHSNVPQNYFESNFPLGQWVSVQRRNRYPRANRKGLNEKKLAMLDKLAFLWTDR